MSTRLLSLYGLKFNPFLPNIPFEALFTTPTVDVFLRRVESGIADGSAIGRTFPAFAFCSSAGIEPNTVCTSPARIATSAGALPL